MAYNFLRGDRDQPFLLPPDLRDWLPAGHLAWFILDVVDQLDPAPFCRPYRDDGHGHPAYDPKTLLGVLLYAYCIGVRSSRQLERRCQEDIAFRVLAANQTPDHVTIARFRARHETALAGFLVESLKLCAAAGMVRVGTVALDGTKLAANAADKANRTHDKLEAEVAEILRQAAAADQCEDRLFGDALGDELPEALASEPVGWRGCARPRPSSRPRPPRGSRPTGSGPPPTPQQPPRRAENPACSSVGHRRRPTPRLSPTSPILTAASCTPATAACRATTPRRSLPCTSSSWPPRLPTRPTTSTSSSPCCKPPPPRWPPRGSTSDRRPRSPTPATGRSTTSPPSPTRRSC
jgi:transposase